MKKEDDKIVIKVLVGNIDMPITIKREQEETYRKAAKAINEKLAQYQVKYPGLQYERYLTVVTLEFAVKVYQAADTHNTEPYRQAIEKLTREFEEIIGNSK